MAAWGLLSHQLQIVHINASSLDEVTRHHNPVLLSGGVPDVLPAQSTETSRRGVQGRALHHDGASDLSTELSRHTSKQQDALHRARARLERRRSNVYEELSGRFGRVPDPHKDKFEKAMSVLP